MAIFPRPVSPSSAAGDLWGYLVEKRPHKWPLLALSATLTGVIIWAFITDANTNTMPGRNKITYFQSWDSNRSDAQVILQQKLDLAEREIAMRKKQQEMRKIADAFGIEWREEAARNDVRHKKALKRVNEELDQRLAKAEAQAETTPSAKAEAAPAKTAAKANPETPVPPKGQQ